MRRIAIIPARGGSKRIPKKNIRLFLGEPILQYSIRAALQTGFYDTVMVSTDDEEIAEVAKNAGADVPFMRSKKNSNDYASTYDVLEEVLLQYQQEEIVFEEGVCIYPCAPFVTAEILKQAHDLLKKELFTTVFPVIPYSTPIQRALKKQNDSVSFIHPENALKRSQDLEVSYHDAGQFYTFNVERLLACGKLISEHTGGIEISELQAQDIDNIADWELAELKYKLLQQK